MKSIYSNGVLRYVVIPGMLILTVVAVLNVFIYERELGFFSNIYNNEVAGTRAAMNRRFQSAAVAVESVRALFLSSETVTEEEFNSFGSILTKNIGAGVIAMPITIEWVDEQNKIRYIYPMDEDNARIIGLDLNQYPNRLIPINKAKATRSAVVTEPIMLGQGYPGLLLYSPIYKGDTYGGAALVVIRLANLVTPVPGSAPIYDKEEYIQTGNFIIPFDDDIVLNNNGERIINPQGDVVKDPIAEEYAANAPNVLSEDIVFADKTWQLKHSPTYITAVNTRMVYYGGFSVLFVLSVIIFLWVLHKRREQLLRETARTRALMMSIGDGLVACDKNGTITYANKKAEELSGYGMQESAGKSYYDVWRMVDANGVDIPRNERPFYRALTHKEVTHIGTESHLLIIAKGGTSFPIASTIAPILVEGRVEGAIAVFTDITKESDVDRMKSEFISLASHQLRTPITAVSWNAEMLLGGDVGPLNKEQKDIIERIHESGKNMSELVGGFLEIEKIEAGGFVIEKGDVDIVQTSESVVGELASQIADKKLHVVKKYGDAVPHLSMGTKTARIILQNLLTNAIKYTPAEGAVEITIEKSAGGVTISVKDNGYGIPENAKSRIFTKLFRADNAREKEPTGTGLGLYLLKSLVDKLGGKVWFESKEGVGSTFYVTLK